MWGEYTVPLVKIRFDAGLKLDVPVSYVTKDVVASDTTTKHLQACDIFPIGTRVTHFVKAYSIKASYDYEGIVVSHHGFDMKVLPDDGPALYIPASWAKSSNNYPIPAASPTAANPLAGVFPIGTKVTSYFKDKNDAKSPVVDRGTVVGFHGSEIRVQFNDGVVQHVPGSWVAKASAAPSVVVVNPLQQTVNPLLVQSQGAGGIRSVPLQVMVDSTPASPVTVPSDFPSLLAAMGFIEPDLSHVRQVLESNSISDATTLKCMSDEDLKELNLNLGQRRKITTYIGWK